MFNVMLLRCQTLNNIQTINGIEYIYMADCRAWVVNELPTKCYNV